VYFIVKQDVEIVHHDPALARCKRTGTSRRARDTHVISLLPDPSRPGMHVVTAKRLVADTERSGVATPISPTATSAGGVGG